MIVNDLFESAYAGNTERAVARNMNRAADDQAELNEFAPGSSGGGSDYLKELASAWYNGVFNTGSLPRGIKTQEDIERLLQRGIVCPDGKTRKLNIDYNSNFDGVVIFSDDYYEHGDLDGNDGRTGQPWGPYDHMEFKDEELDEGVAEGWTKLPSGDYQNSHTGVRTSKPPAKKKRGEKTGAEWDAINAKKQQGVAEAVGSHNLLQDIEAVIAQFPDPDDNYDDYSDAWDDFVAYLGMEGAEELDAIRRMPEPQANSALLNHLKQIGQSTDYIKNYQPSVYEAGVAEGPGNIGSQIKAVYKKIYDAGDDAVEFAYYDSPIFAQYWDEYEGDLDSIIAEVDPSELQIILDELTSAADDQGLAEADDNLKKKVSNFVNPNIGTVADLPVHAGLQRFQASTTPTGRHVPALSIGDKEGPYAQISPKGAVIGYRKTFESASTIVKNLSAMINTATSRSDLRQIRKYVNENVRDIKAQQKIMEQATQIVSVRRRQHAAKAAK